MTAEFGRTLEVMDIGVAFVQEQYTFLGKTRGIDGRCVVLEKGSRPMAGIAVSSSLPPPLFLDRLSSEHLVCASIVINGVDCYFISVYFQFGEAVDTYVAGLAAALDALRGRPVVVAGDFNARSPSWHDDREPGPPGQSRAREGPRLSRS